ncbi:MAG TPA: gamma-glutamyltransferase family protein, partial [Planctomycetota bacterium]|nr:gamma-glutamyltransferase family protein [Planctomycetota bacterium]
WEGGRARLSGLNASGRSPRELSRELLVEKGHSRIPARGPLPITVPGCVDGWCELHARFGRLPMAEVLAAAVDYAEEGFPVGPVVAVEWEKNVQVLAEFAGFVEQFTLDGRAPRAGEVFRNPHLARTLRAVADGGREAFYRGDIARAIEAAVEQAGGFLCYEDLAEHRSEWVEPVSATYRGVELWELAGNAQGLAALQILNVLERFDVAALGFGSPEYIHLFVEAKKLAYEDRARWYADPDFCQLPVAELASKEYAARRAELIDARRAAAAYPAGNPALDAGDTVILCTGDRDGNLVSLIQSNYRGMGSGIAPKRLGFVLQDRGELFDLKPGRFNTYEPGKRPFHTLMPAFATKDGEPWMCFGVMGGAAQPQMHAQVLVDRLDFGMDVQEACDAPRFLHQGSSDPTGLRMKDGGSVAIESGHAWETVRGLLERGHVVTRELGLFGGCQAIGVDAATGVLAGASEPRKDGHAAGF